MTYRGDQLALCLVLLGAAAASDVAARRLPNVVTVALLASGLGAQLAARGGRAALFAAALALATGATCAVAWRLRLLGAGDVKLAAAAAAWVGPERALLFAAATALAGGVVSAVALAVKSRVAVSPLLAQGLARAAPSARAGITVPYGVAIAAGAAGALAWSP